jgi:reactive chlorine resistance protein C
MNVNSPLHDNGAQVERVGTLLLRYGLALIFVWFGFLKFTAYEADGIAPLAMHSPLPSWAFAALGKQGLSNAIGMIELAVGVLIAVRAWSAKLSAVGSIGAALTFLITLTFLFSTPGVWQEGMGFPFLSGMVGQFLIKDVVLFAASVWTAGEALRASRGFVTTAYAPTPQMAGGVRR